MSTWLIVIGACLAGAVVGGCIGRLTAHWQLLALLLLPAAAYGNDVPELVLEEPVTTCAEVNHFYDEQGRLVFDQLIFYDWSQERERFDVRAWRLIKNPSQLPERDWIGGGYQAVWQDGDAMRRVRSESVRETWTQYDPELVNREVLPKERRRELIEAGRRALPAGRE